MRRGLLVFLVALSMLAALPARADDLATAINNARGSGLAVDGSIDGFAQAAAQRIAAGQNLVHSNLGALGSCTAAGEVIGRGPNIASVIGAFAGSPGHWARVLDRMRDCVGADCTAPLPKPLQRY